MADTESIQCPDAADVSQEINCSGSKKGEKGRKMYLVIIPFNHACLGPRWIRLVMSLLASLPSPKHSATGNQTEPQKCAFRF